MAAVRRSSNSHSLNNMRAMKAIFFMLGLVVPLVVTAQRNSLTFLGGASQCTLRGNDIFRASGPTAGALFGMGYARQIKGGFGLQAQLLNERRGGALPLIYTDENGTETGRDEIRYLFDHVSLAIGANYRTPGKVHALTSLSVVPAWLRQGTVIFPQLPGNLGDFVHTDVTDNVWRWGVSAAASAGMGWQFSTNFSVSAEVRYLHGFGNLSNTEFFVNEVIRERTLSGVLGLSYVWFKPKP